AHFIFRVTGRIRDRVKRSQARNVNRRICDKEAVSAVLLDEHAMRNEGLVDVVRVRIGNARFALRSEADLNKIAEGAIAGLPADEGIHAAAVIEMLARLDRRREGRAGGMPI